MVASCVTTLNKITNSSHLKDVQIANSSEKIVTSNPIVLGKKNTKVSQHDEAPKAPENKKKKSASRSDSLRVYKEQDLESAIKKLKQENLKQKQILIKKHTVEKQLLLNKSKQQAKKDKENYDREIRQMKRNYQVQLDHIRDIYHSQNIEMQNGLKDAFESRIEDMRKTYENKRANNSDDRLEKLERWLHEELVSGQLQRMTSQLEQTKAFYDFEINKLIQQLDEKDEDITFLEDKIKEIAEEYLPEKVQMEIFDELALDDEESTENGIDEESSKHVREEQK